MTLSPSSPSTCQLSPRVSPPSLYKFSPSPLFSILLQTIPSTMATDDLNLPPGFRFHPTDEELVMHYLCRKCASLAIPAPIVAEIDLYKYDPWDLPGLALYGDKEWYFFSPRDRKYPNGTRPNRAAGCGYWKATGTDKPIGNPKAVGIKKALVFYSGKAPRGEKTNWIMHEYRLADVDRSVRKKERSLRLDDWVLCRIYYKKGAVVRQSSAVVEEEVTTAAMVYEDKVYVEASESMGSEVQVMSPEVESGGWGEMWPPLNYMTGAGSYPVEELLAYVGKPG